MKRTTQLTTTALERLIKPFLEELMPSGGSNIKQSHWQQLVVATADRLSDRMFDI